MNRQSADGGIRRRDFGVEARRRTRNALGLFERRRDRVDSGGEALPPGPTDRIEAGDNAMRALVVLEPVGPAEARGVFYDGGTTREPLSARRSAQAAPMLLVWDNPPLVSVGRVTVGGQ